MTNKFNSRIQEILQLSQREAERFHSPLIKTEHLMLGILRDGKGRGVEALLRHGVDLVRLRMNIEQSLYNTTSDNFDSVPTADSGATDTLDENEQHLSRDCDRTMKLSQLEARMMKEQNVAPEHIILAMLKDDRSVVSQLLMQYNVDYSSYYKQVAEIGHIDTRPGTRRRPARRPAAGLC